ncbi:MAG TPA: hypothetical protein VFO76_07615 [Candidatus Kapabacteria bacterium]|nr:hypothetical protein [Candidatus Kapabacteria bacterium]
MKTKAHHFLTLGIFTCTLTMQGFGLQPAVKPCCAAKVNPRKSETALKEEKKKYSQKDQKVKERDTDE